jgi:hypothetical protein
MRVAFLSPNARLFAAYQIVKYVTKNRGYMSYKRANRDEVWRLHFS